MTFLLDTNVVSELRKVRAHPQVGRWFAGTRAADLYLSVLVLGEVRQGIERLRAKDPTRADAIELWLAQLRDTFGDRIVPVSTEIAETWGRLNAARTIPVVDGLMAATALVHEWTLVTRNTADAAGTGARVLDPFREQPQ